jgi:hypothetical protein
MTLKNILFITASLVLLTIASIFFQDDFPYIGEFGAALLLVLAYPDNSKLRKELPKPKTAAEFSFSYFKKTPNGKAKGFQQCTWELLPETLTKIGKESDGGIVYISFRGEIGPEAFFHMHASKLNVHFEESRFINENDKAESL